MKIDNTNNFITESNPKKNINTLAEFSLSDVSSSLCLTEKVHQNLPKTDISLDTLREICVLGTGTVLLAAPFCLLAQKVYQCVLKNFSETFQCTEGLAQAIANPANMMFYFCFASLTTIAGVGTYAALRRCLADTAKQERFDMLDKEYTEAAAYLLKQYRASRGQEKTDLVILASKLIDKIELIQASLRKVARLTEPQTNVLIIKLSSAAKSILAEEQKLLSQKTRV